MRVVAIVIGLFALVSCNNDPRLKLPATGMFGETFETGTATIFSDSIPENDSTLLTISYISGTIQKYCKGEGCWLVLETSAKQPIKVITKDKAFILPRNIDGKMVIAKGSFLPPTKEDGSKRIFEATGILIQ